MNIPEYYRDLLHPRLHPLGGASSLHAYWNEIERKQNDCKEFDMQKFRRLLKKSYRVICTSSEYSICTKYSYNASERSFTDLLPIKSDIFANLSVKEYEKGLPVFVISVIHGAAQDLPDPLDYFKRKAPEIPVKVRPGIKGP